MYNRADIGGALVAHNSSVNVDKSTLSYNTANFGGAMVTFGSTVNINITIFTHNSALGDGGVMMTYNDMVRISSSTFSENVAYTYAGVALTIGDSTFKIDNSNFFSNIAAEGGVMYSSGDSSFNISNCNFTSNSATFWGGVMDTSDDSLFKFNSYSAKYYGGVMSTSGHSSFTISNSNFTSNNATWDGGVVHAKSGDSSFNISNCDFTSNIARYMGGVMYTSMAISGDSSFNISNCDFTSNDAAYGGVTFGHSPYTISNSNFTLNRAYYGSGGVIYTSHRSSFTISNSNFASNSANSGSGGVMYTFDNSSFNISTSHFTSNSAYTGGVVYVYDKSSFTMSDCYFRYNSATGTGGILRCSGGTLLSIDNSNFSSNTVNNLGGGLIFISQCPINIANTTYDDNVGSIYTFNTNLRFSGYLNFKNSRELITAENESTKQEGGAITSIQSTVFFTRESTTHYSNNRARDGGAIIAIESTIIMYGETIIANNNMTTVANSIGGGFSLKQSRLEIRGKCNLVNNSAVRGGGIHATSSTIAVYQSGSLQLVNNNAEYGGGMYLDVISKLYVLKTKEKTEFDSKSNLMNFTGNYANYGGAVYVADDTNSGTCSPGNECFIQTLALYTFNDIPPDTTNILFSESTATKQGSNLFGGLLDRCIPSPFAELYSKHYSGIIYLQSITENQNITKNVQVHSISSQPVRVCFCNIQHKPDCSYQLSTITVKKGEAFNVSVVAVDQVNNTVDANITASISSSDGGFGEGQQT